MNEYNLILYDNITFRKQRGLIIILRGISDNYLNYKEWKNQMNGILKECETIWKVFTRKKMFLMIFVGK